jgi:hypothetical protein
MTNNTYRFDTPEHSYTIEPVPHVPKLVSLQSENREALEEALETIHLAGVADDEDFSHLTIEEDMTDVVPFFYIELSTSTLALWWEFEALNFIGAPVNV